MRRPGLRPWLYLAGAVLLWGSSFAATKTAMRSFSPMAVMWLRMVVASLVFLPFWRRVPRPDRRPGDARYLGLAVLFVPCLYYLFEGFAVRLTTSSQAAVVSAVMPLLVGAGAWVFLRERPAWQAVAGIVVSMAGVAVLSLGGAPQAAAPNPALGNVLELVAMVVAAGSTLVVKHLSARYDAWLLTGLQALVGAGFFAAPALVAGLPDLGSVPAVAWIAVLYLGTACSLGAFGLYNSALRLLPASRAALSINLIPAVAMLAGWVLLGEALTPLQIAACAMIVGAVVFAEVAGRVPPEEQPVR